MRVSDLMSTWVVAVQLDAPFKTVVEAMLTNDVSGVAVLDEAGVVVGVISEADLISKEAFPAATVLEPEEPLEAIGWGGRWMTKAAGLTAKDVMSSPALTANPDESIQSAARRMVRARVRLLPVVDANILVGMITRRDILHVFGKADALLALQIRNLLRGHRFDLPGHRVDVAVEGGVVTLSGRLADPGDCSFVIQVVEAVEGVVGVRNELLI